MNASQSVIRIDGRRQRTVRLVWLAIVIPNVLLHVASLGPYYRELLDIYGQSAAEGQLLFGLPAGSFVAYELALFLFRRLVFSAVGLTLFLFRSDELVPVMVSLLFMLYDPNRVTTLLVLEYPGLELPVQLLEYVWLVLAPLVMYLFPDGRFVPRATKGLAPVVVLLMAALVFGPLQQLEQATFSLIVNLFVTSGVLALIYRYRHSSAGVRQQLKWPVYSLTLWLAVYTVSLAFALLILGYMPRAAGLLHLAVMAFVPVSLAFAIFRYKLWEIDFLINRTLVFGALALLFVLIFAGSLLLVLNLFPASTTGNLMVVVVSVTAFGLLYQGAHRRVQRFVDRRFYGINIPYQKPVGPVAAGKLEAVTHFDHFQNLELIGRGGMAEVYRALHPKLGRPVAIKLIASHLSDDEQYRHRFLREARIAAGLQHPNIIRIHDYGELAEQLYMVMDFLDGQDLRSYLKEHGRLSVVQAMPILTDVATALDYAHSQGVIHRDVKPGNIMLMTTGRDNGTASGQTRAVLMDFGLARTVGQPNSLTEGMMLGTLDYIPPEQIQASADIGPAADIYAFGVMAYQMLTGNLPFPYHNPGALLIAHLNQPPPDPRRYMPELSQEAAEALLLALAKEPANRMRSAGALVRALRAAEGLDDRRAAFSGPVLATEGLAAGSAA